MNVATVASPLPPHLMRAAAIRVLVLLRPTIARLAPSTASVSAAANPMPLVAPVIRICLSFMAQQSKGSGHAIKDLALDQVRANGASQQRIERCALTKSPPRRGLARRIGSVRNFGQRSFREAFVCELRRRG